MPGDAAWHFVCASDAAAAMIVEVKHLMPALILHQEKGFQDHLPEPGRLGQ
jgi:hypothetical protein